MRASCCCLPDPAGAHANGYPTRRQTTEEGQAISKSYQQLYKQLLEALSKGLGCTEIEAQGKEFDFNFHEAITRQPSATVPENHVVDVLQRGFAIGSRLVRPAGVMVSVGPAEGGGSSASAAAKEDGAGE